MLLVAGHGESARTYRGDVTRCVSDVSIGEGIVESEAADVGASRRCGSSAVVFVVLLLTGSEEKKKSM